MFTNVRGHYSMAIVCRRSSVSTSFMLAALRVLHVDISNALGTGSLDRAKAICASAFACVQGSRHGVYSVVALSRLACMFVAGGGCLCARCAL
jgi:hypothetical protein